MVGSPPLRVKPDLKQVPAPSQNGPSPRSSPDRRPRSPLMERRPPLSPVLEAQLRHACAAMVNEYMSLDDVDGISTGDVYATSNKASQHPRAADDWARRAFRSLRRPSDLGGTDHGVSEGQQMARPSAARYVPQNAVRSFAATTSSRPGSIKDGRRPSLGDGHHALHPGRSETETPHRTGPAGPYDVPAASATRDAKSSGVHESLVPQHVNVSVRASVDIEPASSQTEGEGSSTHGGRMFGYLRSQPSAESLGSTYSVESVARSWWRRGSLRRQNSNSSHRAEVAQAVPSQEIDLNRALPPLPSLSTWKPDDRSDDHDDRRIPRSEQPTRRTDVPLGQPGLPKRNGTQTHAMLSEPPARARKSNVRGSEDSRPHPRQREQDRKKSAAQAATRRNLNDQEDRQRRKRETAQVTVFDEGEKKSEAVQSETGTRTGKLKRQLSKMAMTGFRFHRPSKRDVGQEPKGGPKAMTIATPG